MKREFFIKSAGLLLLLTASAKLFGFFSTVPVAGLRDPILGLRFRDVFLAAGLIELAAACFCLFTSNPRARLWLLAWLGSGFAVYRVGLALIGIELPCPCFGNLAQVLHLSTATANMLASGMLVYILAGACYGLSRREAPKTPEQLPGKRRSWWRSQAGECQ